MYVEEKSTCKSSVIPIENEIPMRDMADTSANEESFNEVKEANVDIVALFYKRHVAPYKGFFWYIITRLAIIIECIYCLVFVMCMNEGTIPTFYGFIVPISVIALETLYVVVVRRGRPFNTWWASKQ